MIPVLDTFTFRGLTYESLSVPAFDGTPLHVERAGRPDGPVILLANGIGVRWYGFAPVFERLAPDACVLSWDYRGMGGSTPLASDALEIPDQASDALAVLDALAPGRQVAALGWSMGVPVLVEAHRLDPARFSRLALVFGAPGLPFVHAFSPAIDRVIRGVLGTAVASPLAPLALQAALSRVEPVVREFLYRIRFAGRRTDPELFQRCVEGVLANRLEVYGRTLLGLCLHDGWDHLPDMRVPAWVAGGTADWVTPHPAMERTAALLPDATYHEIPGASHFGLLENHPGLLDNLARFLLH